MLHIEVSEKNITQRSVSQERDRERERTTRLETLLSTLSPSV